MTKMDKNGTQKPTRRRGATWWPLVVAMAGLLILATAVWWGVGRGVSQSSNSVPQADGPRLAVDRDSIDLGTQPFERRVSAVFQVTNIGNSALNMLGEPSVELVEGC